MLSMELPPTYMSKQQEEDVNPCVEKKEMKKKDRLSFCGLYLNTEGATKNGYLWE